jgi:lipopolysaccharide export system permease protein
MFTRVFGVFLSILLLIDIIEQLRRYTNPGISFGEAFYLSLLNVPESLYQILPLIMILTAIALFLGLARSSELVVVRAAGRSGLRFLAAPVGAALLIGVVSVAVLNPLVAATSKEYDELSANQARGEGESILSISAEGLWMRQGDAQGQTVIHAKKATPDGGVLQDVSFFLFGPDGRVTGRIEADSARLEPGQWVLDGAKIWDLTTLNPESGATAGVTDYRLATDLTPDRIQDSIGLPSDIAFWNLASQARNLERAGFSARAYRLWLQMELALPLLLAAMVMFAAGFTMRHARFGKTGQMVLYALLGGFLIFFLRNFAQVLGENGQIPILVAAWSPPIAAALLSLSLLLHLEDG